MKDFTRHPAKFSDNLIPAIADNLCKYVVVHKDTPPIVLDPFAGTGKIAELKSFTPCYVVANEIEPEWSCQCIDKGCDEVYTEDAQFLTLSYKVDAIVTSPTYGNRMADHHNAKDNSKRNTYTHCIGRQLTDGNTGKMQFGEQYKTKHIAVYENLLQYLAPQGIFILNVSNFIRKGEEVDVVSFHTDALISLGLQWWDDTVVQTHRLTYGANRDKRVSGEHILVFKR